MYKNYIKIALNSLKINPFFTGVSLFGIGFTLMLLVLLSSFIESGFGDNKPLGNKDRLLICSRGKMLNFKKDTITTIDTTFNNGEMQVDSNTQILKTRQGIWTSQVGYKFLNEHYREIPKVEVQTFFNHGVPRDVFVGDTKLALGANHTDEGYWRVFDFDFVEGKGYSKSDVDGILPVAVITTKASKSIFGKESGVLDQEFTTNGRSYKVIGVVKPSKSFAPYINQDLFFPITHLPQSTLENDDFLGEFSAAFLGESKSDLPQIKSNFDHITQNISTASIPGWDKLELQFGTLELSLIGEVGISNDPEKDWKFIKALLFGLVGLFIAVPTINLINLNVSRIMERSSEIGVRKAFGATSSNIVSQLVFENIILTILGGLIGFMAAYLVIRGINNSSFDLIPLEFNGTVFVQGVVLILIFGIISGILPAYRMSKMHIISALKNSTK